ncbi:MAG: V-type ATPase subunit [Anaerolineales bacterium]|jgi:vacuolar-type H+-ATPase subunit C/Vma6
MAEFDYGNARLRAMKSRLLSRHDLEALTEAESLQGLISALTKTTYRQSVEAALTHVSGMDCIHLALRNELIATLGKVHGFFHEQAEEMIAIVLRAYDVHNMIAILRGLAKNAPQTEILSTLLPVGDVSLSLLAELMRASNPRDAIDLSASMNLLIAQPLLKLRIEHPGAETDEMELALNKWYFAESQRILSEKGGGERLSSALKQDADIANLITVFRFVYAPKEKTALRERFRTDDIAYLFVGPGFLTFELLVQLSQQRTLSSLLNILDESPYGPALADGQIAFDRSGRLSEFEKSLNRFRLNWMGQQIAKDPLGIGVFLGYQALKTNEIKNIRWIAQGINNGANADAIQSELEFVL